jgi:hypothetical protein
MKKLRALKVRGVEEKKRRKNAFYNFEKFIFLLALL